MINKTALCTLGLFVGSGVLLFAGGMDTENFLANLTGQERPVIRVIAGAAQEAAGAGSGAAMQFELTRCGGDAPIRAETVSFRAGALAQFSDFADMPVRTETPHRFADIAWRVDAGCYQVRARVVDAAGRAVATCDSAGTPSTFLSPNQSQAYALLLDCGGERSPGLRVRGELNHAPALAPLRVERQARSSGCSATKICASARDRDADPMSMHWSVTGAEGQKLQIPQPQVRIRNSRERSERTECIVLEPGVGAARIDVTVRDLAGESSLRHARPISFEDIYLGDFGLVAQSRAYRTVQVQNTCRPATCPEDPAARIRNIRYWISRDGALLAPTADLSRVREGDTVDVRFEVAPGCDEVRLTFASFYDPLRQRDPAAGPYSRPASIFTRIYDAGAHMLWNVLPECRFRVELRLGPPEGRETEAAPLYIIDSFSGGTRACAQR